MTIVSGPRVDHGLVENLVCLGKIDLESMVRGLADLPMTCWWW